MSTGDWIRRAAPLPRSTDRADASIVSHADFEVIQRVLEGEAGAFDVLVSRHQQAIFRLSYRMTRNVEDARDIAQEAFVQAFRSLGSFRRQASFLTWLYRIAMNLCLNHRKATMHEDPAEVDARVPDDREDSLTALLMDERDRALTAAIEALPPQQRATLTLRVHQELSHREIAEVLGCAEGTAKANYFHAVRALRRKLAAFTETE
ncbi:MAG: sigma-70 family RNA polymerase sigma factor [Candidatus Methylomirabilota bacterium]